MQKKQSLTIALFCFYTSIFSVSHAEDSISKHFGYGKIYAGIQAGWGKAFSLGIAGQGDGRNVEFVAMLPHIGMGLTDILGKDSWYQGNLDAILQARLSHKNMAYILIHIRY